MVLGPKKLPTKPTFQGDLKTNKKNTGHPVTFEFCFQQFFFETPGEILEKITDMFGDLWGDTCRNGLA